MDGDDQLLAAWAAGDAEAGNALIERHFDRLYRFFEMTVPSHAQDLVQETFVACLESPERYRGESSLSAFLLGIARKKALMFWRTHARRGAAVDFDRCSLQDLGASPTGVLAQAEHERLLVAGLRRIPLEAQILLQLHYWESLPGPALARVLEIPEGTVRSRLRRARELLVAAIEDLRPEEALLRSTVDDLEGWARAMGERRPPKKSDTPR